MRTAQRLALGVLIAAILLHAGRAWAPFHVVVVDQVFFGTADCPNAQYVTMRMLAAGMQFINGQHVTVQNADGSDAPEFGTFAANVPHGAAGDHFIMGTAAAAGLFGITMDQTATGSLVVGDGRVCFGNFGGAPVDCVAYGNFTGDNTGGGSPATAPPLGMALMRQANSSQNGNDAADFVAGAPAPVNNAGDSGTLGQCPGGAGTPTATPETATATPTQPPPHGCVGDCDGSGTVAINELVTCVNIALGGTPITECPSCDCQGTQSVPINCLIQGVNNALNMCPAVPLVAH